MLAVIYKMLVRLSTFLDNLEKRFHKSIGWIGRLWYDEFVIIKLSLDRYFTFGPWGGLRMNKRNCLEKKGTL